MSYRSERFNRAMLSLDSCGAVSDNGQGVERITAAIDRDWQREAKRERAHDLCLDIARCLLILGAAEHLLPTLELIIENRNDSRRSIEKQPRATYFRNRAKLLDFFDA